MQIKKCPRCQKINALANQNCVGCGHLILYEKVRKEKQRRNLMTGLVERLFSFVLLGCALVSVFFAVEALLKQPVFSALF